jgi:hypothetical protein
MRLLLSTICMVVSAASAADWVSIQPEAALKGWTRLPIPPGAPLDAATQWSISPNDGDLVCDGAKEKGHEWLRYERELKNFVLHVEWRFRAIPGETKYNSGVFVRNSANGGVWYQAQIGPPANGGYFFQGIDEGPGKGKRVNYKSQIKANVVKEPGEWNTYDIRANGKNVTLSVNGTETSAFECDRLSGYIGVEAEHYHIEFRNLKLQELP